jgi:hypothetical protein
VKFYDSQSWKVERLLEGDTARLEEIDRKDKSARYKEKKCIGMIQCRPEDPGLGIQN